MAFSLVKYLDSRTKELKDNYDYVMNNTVQKEDKVKALQEYYSTYTEYETFKTLLVKLLGMDETHTIIELAAKEKELFNKFASIQELKYPFYIDILDKEEYDNFKKAIILAGRISNFESGNVNKQHSDDTQDDGKTYGNDTANNY